MISGSTVNALFHRPLLIIIKFQTLRRCLSSVSLVTFQTNHLERIIVIIIPAADAGCSVIRNHVGRQTI